MSKIFHQLLFAILLLLVSPLWASAHATPVTYTPASAATVATVPAEVVIDFSERIESESSAITVLGPAGQAVHEGTASVDGENQRVYKVPLVDAGEGVYTVSWQVVSADDGHFTKGAFAFLVDETGKEFAGTSGQIQIQHVTKLPEAVFSFLNLVGQSLVVAVTLFILLRRWVPADWFKPGLLQCRLRRSFVAGSALMVLGTGGYIIIKTFDLQQLRSTDFGKTLRLFLATNAGTYALYRLCIAFAFLTLYRWLVNIGQSTKYVIATLIGSVALIALFQSVVSHAAATEFAPWLNIVLTAVHLLGKEFLVGGLLLTLVLVPILSDRNQTGRLFQLYNRFSLSAILLGGLSGAYIVWLHLKDFEYLFHTEWGGRLGWLLLFSGFLICLRTAHLVLGTVWQNFAKRMGRFLVASHLLEAGVGLIVLFFSGYISMTTPPITVEEYDFRQTITDQNLTITLAPDVYQSETLLIETDDNEGNPTESELVVTAENNAAGIETLVIETKEEFPGRHSFPYRTLNPEGNWHLRVVAQQIGGYDAIANFEFDFPADIESTLVDHSARDFNTFGLVMILVAVAVIGYVTVFAVALRRKGVTTLEIPAPVGNKWVMIIVPIVSLLVLTWVAVTLHSQFFQSDFEKQCRTDGHFWLQSAVMYNGETTSPNTATGCTVSVGLFHFVEVAAYEKYLAGADLLNPASELQTADIVSAGATTTLAIELAYVIDGQRTPVQEVAIAHDRAVHLLVIGEDLQTFSHVHPEKVPDTQGRYTIDHVFPKAGKYVLLVDYVVKGREIQERFEVAVTGEETMAEFVPDYTRTKTYGEYEVTLHAPEKIQTGESLLFTYEITKNGEPVKDLEPYLAAAMHIGVIRSDLRQSFHTHGEIYVPGSSMFQFLLRNYIAYHAHFVPAKFGPKVQVPVEFDLPGTYTLFGEFKDEGEVVVTEFVVGVE